MGTPLVLFCRYLTYKFNQSEILLACLVISCLLCGRLGVLWQHGGWHLESAWPSRHGPSQIPTDLDLPHKAFGSQVVHDSIFERPDILPFSIYAACRILDTTPDDEVGACMHNGQHGVAAPI